MDTDRIASDIPRSLREWRDREDITMNEAAKRLRITQSYYSKLENETSYTRGKLAKRIHQKTQVPVAVLVGAA